MDRGPDRQEKRIRFGCGFSFGLIIGFFVAVREFYSGGVSVLVLLSLAAAGVCGWLAVKYGDEFWRGFLSKWWWWM